MGEGGEGGGGVSGALCTRHNHLRHSTTVPWQLRDLAGVLVGAHWRRKLTLHATPHTTWLCNCSLALCFRLHRHPHS